MHLTPLTPRYSVSLHGGLPPDAHGIRATVRHGGCLPGLPGPASLAREGVCPRCKGRTGWVTRRGLWLCAGCRHQLSVTAGTIFHDTRLPLTLWFRAIWWVTSQKTGASALGLQRVLGLGSYRTAWTWLHKLRRAMIRPGRDSLTGRVEVDETYLGGAKPGKRGRGAVGKALIVVAAQEDGRGVGRVRMRRNKDASAASLHPFVLEAIAPGTIVHTDGWGTPAWRNKATAVRSRSGSVRRRSSCPGSIGWWPS